MQSNQIQNATGPQVGDVWYRYSDRLIGSIDEWGDVSNARVSVECHTFVVCKVTPRGVWVQPQGFAFAGTPPKVAVPQGNPRDVGARLVILDACKQFASATKERALDGYLARKKCQVRIYESRLKYAKDALAQATAMKTLADNTEQRAWALYCQETAGGADVRDHWEELSPPVQALYLQKVRNPAPLAA